MIFLVGLQPVCTSVQFEDSCNEVLSGEQKGIALAVFDVYLDQLSEIDESDQLLATQKAAALLTEFTRSLAILDNKGKWKVASDNLRRTVLLHSRKAANPWPATVWVDLSAFDEITISEETKIAIDAFLRQNYEVDLHDRFAAFEAMRLSDASKCEQLTAKAMERWSKYHQIIEPYTTNVEVLLAAFPKLNSGKEVRDSVNKLLDSCTDASISENLQTRFHRWSSLHTTQLRTTAALVRKARSTYLFDPWSPRCGTPSNRRAIYLQQELLQLSASVHEKNQLVIEELQIIANAHETQ